jgi:hypothetical protein
VLDYLSLNPLSPLRAWTTDNRRSTSISTPNFERTNMSQLPFPSMLCNAADSSHTATISDHMRTSVPRRLSFLDLPAEIRIKIYENVVQSIGTSAASSRNMNTFWPTLWPSRALPPPTAPNLHDVSGFPMSCRKIYDKSKHEALKSMKEYLEYQFQRTWLRLELGSPLQLPQPTRLAETINMQFANRNSYLAVRYSISIDQGPLRINGILVGMLLEDLVTFTDEHRRIGCIYLAPGGSTY